MTEFSFGCSCCGEWHAGFPDLSFRAPFYWNSADKAVPDKCHLDSDFCVIGEDRFIRCILLVPIKELDERLGWGVWVMQSYQNFALYKKCFNAPPERVTFGYLSNRLPLYDDTLGMAADVHWTSDGRLPWGEPEPAGDQLYLDWRDGLSQEGAISFAELVLHPQSTRPGRSE